MISTSVNGAELKYEHTHKKTLFINYICKIDRAHTMFARAASTTTYYDFILENNIIVIIMMVIFIGGFVMCSFKFSRNSCHF